MTTRTKLLALAFVAAALSATPLTGATAGQRAHFAGVSASRSSLPTTLTCGLSNCGIAPAPKHGGGGAVGGGRGFGQPGSGGGADLTGNCFSDRDCGPLSED